MMKEKQAIWKVCGGGLLEVQEEGLNGTKEAVTACAHGGREGVAEVLVRASGTYLGDKWNP